MRMKPLTRSWLPVIALLTVLSGCSHYQMGRPGIDPNAPRITVWIAPVLMETAVPDVLIPLQRELREQVIRNTAMRLVEATDNADAELHIVVNELSRQSLARRSDDTGLSDVLRMELTATYQLKTSGGLVSRSGVIHAEGPIFRDAGFQESARQRTPAIVKDLADEILQDAFLGW